MNLLIDGMKGYIILSSNNKLSLKFLTIKLTILHKLHKLVPVDMTLLIERSCLDELLVDLDKMIELLSTEQLLIWVAFVYFKEYFIQQRRLAFGYDGILHHESSKFQVVFAIVVEKFIQSLESFLNSN